jgi:hypothetical protein
LINKSPEGEIAMSEDIWNKSGVAIQDSEKLTRRRKK